MPQVPYPLSQADGLFTGSPGQSAGWTGIACDARAPDGGNGPGLSAGYSLVGTCESLADEHLRALAEQATVASRAKAAFDSDSVVANLERAVVWLGNSALGEAAFQLGVGVGLAQSLWDQLKGLYLLPRTFILAAEYEIALEASHYHVPDWVTHGLISGVTAASGMAAFTIGATSEDEKKAWEEVQSLTAEIKSLVEGGGSKAWAQLKKLGGRTWQQIQADWDKYQSLMNSNDASQMYEAGVMYGRFLGELLTAILLLISIAGAAIRIARLAATGVQSLAELAALAARAQGTEIGTAAQNLLNANTELQVARAAGNASKVAEAEKSVAAATNDLQQKAQTVEQTLEKNAPNLLKESGKLREAQAKGEVAPSGDGEIPSKQAENKASPKEKAKTRKNRAPTTNNKNIDHSKTVNNPDGSTTYFDNSGRPVTYNANGYPDFSPYSEATVKVNGLKGTIPPDDSLANKAVGLTSTPDGYTWHHVEDGQTMQLIPTDIHAEFPHTGGASLLRGN